MDLTILFTCGAGGSRESMVNDPQSHLRKLPAWNQLAPVNASSSDTVRRGWAGPRTWRWSVLPVTQSLLVGTNYPLSWADEAT